MTYIIHQRRSIEKNKIRLYYYLGSGSAILCLVLLLSVTYTKSINQEYRRKIEQLSTGIISEKKRFLKNAVERTISLIEAERELTPIMPPLKNLTKEQLNKISIERTSKRIRDLRLIDDGYVWVNRIINYEGGDKYAIRQIHPNLPHTEGEWLSTNTTDTKGNRPYEVELNGVKKAGEVYFEYYFKKLNSTQIAHKMSFAKLYKPWNWIVATGVYLDDVDELVQVENKKMKATLKKQRQYSYSIATLTLVFSFLILMRFEKQISLLILTHERETKEFTNNLIKEKEKTEQALSEIKQLKGLLPICSNCKKIRDDKGYWNHLELYISKHSDASFSHGICPECTEQLYGNKDWYKKMKKKKGYE